MPNWHIYAARGDGGLSSREGFEVLGLATLLLTTLSARASEDVAAVKMLPNRMLAPAVAAEVEVVGALDPTWPLLSRAAVGLRGIPVGRPGASAAFTTAAVTVDPAGGPAPVGFDLNLSVLRRAAESNPVVAASDVRWGSLRLWRDHALGVDLDGSATLIDASGGLYLPSLFPGDIEARVVVGGRALGARWRRSDPRPWGAPADFVGAALGGVDGEIVYGRRVTTHAVITGQLGGRADWSVGAADGLQVLIDTKVWLCGELGLGAHHALRVTASREAVRWPADGRSALSAGWRAAW